MLSLLVTEKVVEDLQKRFKIEKHGDDWLYCSPNGMLKQTISLYSLNIYGNPSFISIPTSDIEKYPLISEDVMDFYNFSKSFELETSEQFAERVKGLDSKIKGVYYSDRD